MFELPFVVFTLPLKLDINQKMLFFMKSHTYLPPGLSQRHNLTINEHMELFGYQESVKYKVPILSGAQQY